MTEKTIYIPTFGLDAPAVPDPHLLPDTQPRRQKVVSYIVPEVDDRKLVAMLMLVNPETGDVHGVAAQSVGQWPGDKTMTTSISSVIRADRQDVLRFFGLDRMNDNAL